MLTLGTLEDNRRDFHELNWGLSRLSSPSLSNHSAQVVLLLHNPLERRRTTMIMIIIYRLEGVSHFTPERAQSSAKRQAGRWVMVRKATTPSTTTNDQTVRLQTAAQQPAVSRQEKRVHLKTGKSIFLANSWRAKHERKKRCESYG